MSLVSLCTLYTPTLLPFSKPHNSIPPLSSSQTKRRCRVITSVTEDRETVPVVSKDIKVLESSSPSKDNTEVATDTDDDILTGRAINATIVLGFGAFAVTKLLTIDHDYWHGWTLYEILKYVPEHNWIAYEQSLKANPVLAKMAISGVVYSIGDWIAQCYEGKPIFEFDRARLFRSGLVGFTLHGSLSHYYYQLCETLFPFQQWWVVPAKVAFDQTVWLLWVDCIELIWVTILSTYSNEKSESRKPEEVSETGSSTSSQNSKVRRLLYYSCRILRFHRVLMILIMK
ncbi:hypothetical protein TSUD_104870 [Trifolium subterraneum]|uniref:Peroxisomal membrane protein n=1 Tax=Trifolium subterraneum TaxID=3900 RepID=A0A2Z6NCU1_TRISU|nr:hypothetical protein TSUD_104870 [Trifolium subterraneum]